MLFVSCQFTKKEKNRDSYHGFTPVSVALDLQGYSYARGYSTVLIVCCFLEGLSELKYGVDQ